MGTEIKNEISFENYTANPVIHLLKNSLLLKDASVDDNELVAMINDVSNN